MNFSNLLATMGKEARKRNAPVYRFSKLTRNKFQILVSAILSTRTKDETTIKVCRSLFKKIKTPFDVVRLGEKRIQKMIYGVGFYKNKSKLLVKCAKILIEKYGGKVPERKKELLGLPGVGRKVANVVLVHAFNKSAIPVDVHVHRISNLLGIVKTKTPEQTENKLEKIVPKKLWKKFNIPMVAYGQTVCLPKNPKCEECGFKRVCMYYINRKHF
ncbi:MAG: endonuclease III domain-containing protein [Candidatus Anstonellales archaeon]